mmetsp:Transcript_41663/g.90770  ORF Transcript_41663/g.90770 Transcript_41663/m.90770 type:complete len:138 (-) Transcript_41663:108-521(-)
MGCGASGGGRKDPRKVKLSAKLQGMIDKAFGKIDKDNSGEVDVEEATKMFTAGFGAIHTKKFFQEIDKDNSGTIDKEEFGFYFKRILATGQYREQDVIDELQEFLDGGSMPGLGMSAAEDPEKKEKSDGKAIPKHVM